MRRFARFSLFKSLFTTINSITLNLVKAFRIYFFFQASYKKDIGITVPVLTIALLKAAAEK